MIQPLKELVESSSHIVFFGGAGVSTESGIPDFRSTNGLYQAGHPCRVPPERLLSYSYFIEHPDEFYSYYKKNLLHLEAKPNPAHQALAELERRGKLKAVITQNIDGLHQKAGSETVHELHGSVYRNFCMQCRKPHPVEHLLAEPGIPRCVECRGIVRPDVVMYEEMLDETVVASAVTAIEEADLLIIGGASLVVYPAARLVDYFRSRRLVLINRSETSHDRRASLLIRAPIGEVLGECVFGQGLQ